jgi:hypothetical protein
MIRTGVLTGRKLSNVKYKMPGINLFTKIRQGCQKPERFSVEWAV